MDWTREGNRDLIWLGSSLFLSCGKRKGLSFSDQGLVWKALSLRAWLAWLPGLKEAIDSFLSKISWLWLLGGPTLHSHSHRLKAREKTSTCAWCFHNNCVVKWLRKGIYFLRMPRRSSCLLLVRFALLFALMMLWTLLLLVLFPLKEKA